MPAVLSSTEQWPSDRKVMAPNGQVMSKQCWALLCSAEHYCAVLSSGKQCRAVPISVKQCWSVPSSAEQCLVMLSSANQCRAVLSSAEPVSPWWPLVTPGEPWWSLVTPGDSWWPLTNDVNENDVNEKNRGKFLKNRGFGFPKNWNQILRPAINEWRPKNQPYTTT